jgi:outer membrane protein OmpA-like peptidoglycan-associated protein
MRNPNKTISFSKVIFGIAALLSAGGWCAGSDTVILSPATTMWATRGLSQTAAAEAMGAGRLTVNLTGTWYGQKIGFPTTAPQGADIITGIAAFSFGVNQYIDVFASVVGYGVLAGSNEYGQGCISGGAMGVLPLPVSPFSLGAQVALIGGPSTATQVNRNFLDGYDFFEIHNKYELMTKIIETVTFGNDSLGIKLHFNQGASMLLQNLRRKILLLGAGLQGTVHPRVVIGLELNSRTDSYSLNVRTDPLWLTPSVMVRTPYYFNVLAGADLSLSKERPGTAARALEPYRIFGGFNSSFDLLATKRRQAREKSQREKAETDLKVREAQARAVLLARKARADSLTLAKARETEKLRADAFAQKARADSIALADAKKKLDEERSKRSDVEKQLLSTGLLLLDAVYFETGKAQISINSFPYLNVIGKMLAKYPKLQIEVSGHTDNVGKFNNNVMLSQARADAVRRYLIQVSAELLGRVSARGYGPTQPKAPNTTVDGRKMNRRTELQVLNKEALKEYN